MFRRLVVVVAAIMVGVSSLSAAMPGLKPGKVELKSVGPMTFAGSGVLLVGDPKTATVYAINTEDKKATGTFQNMDDLGTAISSALSLSGEIRFGDLAVNPDTGNTFVSISAGEAVHLVRIALDGTISKLDLSQIENAKKTLPNPPEDKAVTRRGRTRNPRNESITDIAFFDGKVMVTGVAADQSPSRVLQFPYPFAENTITTSVDIFHAAHGRVEDATIRTFVPMSIGGEPTLLAGFTCTPLVKFPIEQLSAPEKVRGTTVAELGNRNTPIDMVVYEKGGKTFVLMNNDRRGMMKITTEGMDSNEGLTERVSGGGTAGQPYETIEGMENVRHMDRLNETQAVALIEGNNAWSLTAIDLP